MMRGFIALGSNLGERAALLGEALKLMSSGGLTVVTASHLYESAPEEVDEKQDSYLNMVVEFTFEGGVFELLDRCQEVERSLGRIRPYPHAPRTMDIDILLIEGTEFMDERLKVPHPRLEQRAFVMYPLAEIAPDLILPSGRTAAQVKKSLRNDEIRMIPGG
ncbi:MAG TPA: 2-amino-4-hydroxy-6-hydroxymethyldihydropteridine diphosphokinase [Desulfomonilia bacterium]|nr:2-amino-4-hydroxy-6-hydroxymethyldihydropteridine diphosphokinase [Desulfomonilia bacterium]